MFEISLVCTCNYFLQIFSFLFFQISPVVALIKKKVVVRFWGIYSTWNNESPCSVQIVFLWAAVALTFSSSPQESLDEIQHGPCHKSEFSVKVQVLVSTNTYNLLCDYQIIGIMPNKWCISPFCQLMTWTTVTFFPLGINCGQCQWYHLRGGIFCCLSSCFWSIGKEFTAFS